jgi:membrane-bound serine protease (ClpP class)
MARPRPLSWLALLLLPLALPAQVPEEREPLGLRLELKGPIGPASADYFHRGLQKAVDDGAALILLRMDTPGGLDLAMRDIIGDILNTNIPVITYVAPDGARAASAGTYILYASHVAAMAPATNLGAATPIQLGGETPMPAPSAKEKPAPGKGTEPAPRGDALSHKMVNDAVAYIRGLAALRGRNADWAEQAVRDAASLGAPEALKLGVIDLVAADEEALLRQLEGRTVKLPGQERVLHTAGMRLRDYAPDWRVRLLDVVTNPNVAYLLMILGIWGLILEFSHPGGFLAGTVGAICLMLALFAFQALPINYAGMGLLLLGVGLMVGEAYAPSFGALGVGGVIAFVIGSVMLMNTDIPGFGISRALIGAVALFSALLFTVVLHLLLKARRRPVVSGAEEMVGAVAVANADFTERGLVRAHSELWQAHTRAPVVKGQRLRITRVEGLTLHVEPLTEQKGEEE